MISGQDIYLFLSYILHENIIKNIIICKFNRFHEDSPITPVKKGFFFFFHLHAGELSSSPSQTKEFLADHL